MLNKMLKWRKRNSKGFSLVELIIVIAIMLNSIPTDTAKQSISNVTASFDTTTGNLMGTIVIDKFYMTGTTQGYVPPSINDVSVGTDNVFGTVTPAADSAAEEAAAESTAESTAS